MPHFFHTFTSVYLPVHPCTYCPNNATVLTQSHLSLPFQFHAPVPSYRATVVVSLFPYLHLQGRAATSASSVVYFIRVMKIDKTSFTQSCDISSLTCVTLNPQLPITPVQCQSKWKAVGTNSSNNMPCCWVLVGEKKKASHRHSAPHAGNCADVSTVIRWVRQFEQGEVGYAI